MAIWKQAEFAFEEVLHPRQEHHCIFPFSGCLKTAHTAEESGSRGSLGAKTNQLPRDPGTAHEAARAADTSSSSPVLAREELAELKATLP